MSLSVKLVVVIAILGTGWAAEKPCCVSKKFTGRMKAVTTYLRNDTNMLVITDNRFNIDYDHDMKMIKTMGEVVTMNGTNTTTSVYTSYHDYRHMKEYIMTGNSSLCFVQMSNDVLPEPCVPSTLQHMGTFRMGSTNNGTMANAWMGMSENFHYSMLTSVDDCTPFVMTRYGTDNDGTRITESVTYADITQYMTSPGAFTLPDQCKQSNLVVG